MDARTAEECFKKADYYYREGLYDGAYGCLAELNTAFPNTPNIMFPLARCLRRLGRSDEALAVCEELITRCSDLRAVQLRDYIRKSRGRDSLPPPLPNSGGDNLNPESFTPMIGDILGDPVGPPPIPLPARGSRKAVPWYVWAGIGAVLLVLILPIVIHFARGGAATPAASTETPVAVEQGADTASPPPDPTAALNRKIALFSIGAILLSVLGTSGALFATLKLTGKLPYETALDNAINTTLMAVAITLLSSFVPCLGLIISIYILYKTYEFSFVEFLVFFGINIAVGFVLSGALYVVLLGTA